MGTLNLAVEAKILYDAVPVLMAPGELRTHTDRAIVLTRGGRYEEAEQCYRNALAETPTSTRTVIDLANILVLLGRDSEAKGMYSLTATTASAYVESLNDLAAILVGRTRNSQLEKIYRCILSVSPDHAAINYNFGRLLAMGGHALEGEFYLRNATLLDSSLEWAHFDLARMLLGSNRHSEAIVALEDVLRINPTNVSALADYLFASRHLCRWGMADYLDEQVTERIHTDPAPILTQLAVLGLSAIDQYQQRRLAEAYGDSLFGAILERGSRFSCAPRETLNIRIGYLSGNLRSHATGQLLAGVIENHDRRNFTVFCYSSGPRTRDAIQERIVLASDLFRDFEHVTDIDAATAIFEDNIDILIDVDGYSAGSRIEITAQRPAPVVVNWLGYPGTLGDPRLADYIVGDPIVTPAEVAGGYSETLAILPHCYQPNERVRDIAQPTSRLAVGLPEFGFVFCSFNQTYKLTSDIFSIWCRLLKSVPGSVLWLLKPKTSEAIHNLRFEANAHGVRTERLIFADAVAISEHRARLPLADLALDTHPITSHTTASDALHAGVPLVTMIGKTFVSRVAASLLSSLNLPELVASTEEEYFEVAMTLACEKAMLQELRLRLRSAIDRSAIFDMECYTRNLEYLYGSMQSQALSGIKRTIVCNAAM